MLHLRTGTPGAGKTLSLIDELRHIKDRKIYYHGIPELSDSLGWIRLDNPKNYHQDLTDGAIFILDECQQHFPVRPPKDKVPDAVAFIETHRHRGIDLYFITQHPSLLDHHARRLVGQHTHLQRNFGMPFAIKYTNNKLFDAANPYELKSCEKSTYRFPKEVFSLYKSAEVHTHKTKIPKILFIVPVLIAILAACILYLWHLLHPNPTAGLSPVPAYQRQESTTPSTAKTQTAIDWSTAFVPKIPGLPYTAPLYQDLAKPVVMPIVSGCLANASKCQCYSQQATKIDMPDDLCRLHVKHKTFNPFQTPEERQQRWNKAGRQTLNTARYDEHNNDERLNAANEPTFTYPDEHEPMWVDASRLDR